MDEAEIERLRKAIYRSYGNQPHKKKVWLALLEMYGKGSKRVAGGGAAVNPSLGAAGKSSLFCTPPPTATRFDPQSERSDEHIGRTRKRYSLNPADCRHVVADDVLEIAKPAKKASGRDPSVDPRTLPLATRRLSSSPRT
jgi:hypothetical protein